MPTAGRAGAAEAPGTPARPPVVRPYITAAESLHWGYVDPSRPVPRIIEDTWPDERLSYRARLPDRTNNRPLAPDERDGTWTADGWKIVR